MFQKLLFLLTFFAIGMLATGWWYNNYRIISAQQERDQEKMNAFMAAGGRFTDQDGKVLCERIRALEKYSYGYRNAGFKPLPCNYGNRHDQR